jgi:hypothetical protein
MGKVVLPGGLTIALFLGALAYYNVSVTGNPLRLPYVVHESTYGQCPLFLWDSPPSTKVYRHAVLKEYHHQWSRDAYRRQQHALGWIREKATSLIAMWRFFLGVALTIPLVVIPRFVHHPTLRFALASTTLLLAASSAVAWMLPHYLAPTAPLLFLVVTVALRCLGTAQRAGQRVGPSLVGAVVLLHTVTLVAAIVPYCQQPQTGWQWQRARLLETLEQTPGQHLVLVHYGGQHNVHAEWVYNRADIDGAKVVWARDMGDQCNQPLLDYFRHHRVWHVDADAEPVRFVEFSTRDETMPTSVSPGPD